ncbi:cobaltochelatase subunit CobN [Calycomorphotria hydatis]|uniref:Aerobic cobaltochelatase subunit CobN n=1 Tax=Calycomorphotria hydatis TaxID=2528027 RepID=A0A517TD78_9PLAN|nr:cobaltochelatase subunit CobN [Calycomorphotria hydatis]QDT66324.1 Aerobic cobaltochelatase subunit CobN [Calycomorphotria hydatis]
MNKLVQSDGKSLLVVAVVAQILLLSMSDISAAEPPAITIYGRTSSLATMKESEAELGVEFVGLSADDVESENFEAIKGNVLVLLWGSRRGGGGGRFASGGGGGGRGGGRGRQGDDESTETPTGDVPSRGRGGDGGGRGRGPTAEPSENGERTPLMTFLLKAKKRNPNLRIIATESTYYGMQEDQEFLSESTLEKDEAISKYISGRNLSRESLSRLARYMAIEYLDRPGEILPPESVSIVGLYHPEADKFFPSSEEFLRWSRQRNVNVETAPRVLILATYVHFVSRNRQGIQAMVEDIEQRGGLAAVAMTDEAETRPIIADFGPDVVIDALHRGGELDWYREMGVPHLHGMWLSSRQSIGEWEEDNSRMRNMMGLTRGESTGLIEPHIVSGRTERIEGVEHYVPIPDRIERIGSRALAWAKLKRTPNESKKIVMLHAGPGGPDLNHLSSMRDLFTTMQEAGYTVENIPDTDHELFEELETYGSQIDIAEPHELDRLARSGRAALVPVDQYLEWFHKRIPAEQQQQVIEKWGEAPGNIMAWEDDQQQKFMVIPKIELGNVLLVGKPHPQSEMDGIEDYQARKNSLSSAPSHNILATYFWLEEEHHADAVVVWGALSIDLLLPRKAVGLSQHDWPDILWGSMPNIRPFGLGSLTFAIPAKRRTKAVLVNHLPPATVPAELDDQLQNVASDIVKWRSLSDGSLKDRFAQAITQQVRDLHLDIDIHLELTDGRNMNADEIDVLTEYLNEIDNERIPLNSHSLGRPVRDDLVAPYIVACLGGRFIDALGEIVEVPSSLPDLPSERKKYLRSQAEEIVSLLTREDFTTTEALAAATGVNVESESLPKDVTQGLETAQQLVDGLLDPSAEIDSIVAALSGQFIEPGPGHLPTRNPGAVPTGRNIVPLNPEEIPSRSSWELGKQLIDELLQKKFEEDGEYPNKMAFTLSTRGTMSDYGVLESQILYTLGVRPVWDSGNRVTDIELIPAEELGRPRIDAFVEPKHYYADYLTSRLELIDKAIRLVSEHEEEGNRVAANTQRVREELLKEGMTEDQVDMMAHARIFAVAPDRFGSGLYDGLFSETGVWDTEAELVDIYVSQHDYLYTAGAWGQKAPDIFRKQIQGTDVVLRTLNRRGALAGRAYMSGGTLCMVTKELTGKAPDYYLSDLRQAGNETILSAHDALRKDYRAQLFNRKWIEGQMSEGGRGAAQTAALVWKTLGYSITVDNSVEEDTWREIVHVYLRDSKNMNLPEWFENTNPDAFQELNKMLLEAMRKGYWDADEEYQREVAETYAQSVNRHGPNSPSRNEKLEAFVASVLISNEQQQLAEAFTATMNAPPEVEATATEPPAETELAEAAEPVQEQPAETPEEQPETEAVEGQKMEQVEGGANSNEAWPWFLGLAVVALVVVGMVRRSGGIR